LTYDCIGECGSVGWVGSKTRTKMRRLAKDGPEELTKGWTTFLTVSMRLGHEHYAEIHRRGMKTLTLTLLLSSLVLPQLDSVCRLQLVINILLYACPHPV
jgi:hypothetical protein